MANRELKHKDIISKMSLEYKLRLCNGEDFWHTTDLSEYGLPSLMMCDGPHGLRKQEADTDMLGVNESRKATCFPTAVTTAASWNENLMRLMGETIAEEALAYDVDIVLGPGANIKRNPLCGRNFEYLSEDPYLAGKMAAGFIKGAEGKGVATSLKHFACNSQELKRFTSDSVIDQRTLREIYLTAFEIAVKEGMPQTVMCAYNKINGIHCSDSKELLTDILRDEWGHKGIVVTDWGAMNERTAGFEAGCDLNMPGGSDYWNITCKKDIDSGKLAEETIDICVDRMIELILNCVKNRRTDITEFDENQHHNIARQIAEEGIVLLKNEDNILPISGEKAKSSLALIGDMAENIRYQGAGSSHINPTRLTQIKDVLPHSIFAKGCDEKGNTDEILLAEARKTAKNAEIVVACLGLTKKYESEGFDRENMKMPEGHLRLLDEICKVNKNVIVVLMCGSVVECPWADKVKGILYAGLSGQAGAEAITNILTGKVNPSGKLAESWPIKYGDVISATYYGTQKDALYREGIYVGYRYYDKAKKNVRFPFGYGLSYTSFEYSDMAVVANIGNRNLKNDENHETKGALNVKVCCKVTNTGLVSGKEIVQIYIAAKDSDIHRPEKELKGFKKVELEPGESKDVEFVLTDRDFAIYQDGWVVENCDYEILIGASSRDMRLTKSIPATELKQELNNKDLEVNKKGTTSLDVHNKASFYYTLEGIPSQEDFESILGHKYIPEIRHKGQFTLEDTVEDMKEESLMMKIMYKAVDSTVRKGFGKINEDNMADYKMMMASSAGSPLRSMIISGGMKGGVLPGMLDIANGHIIKGIRNMRKFN